VASLCTTVVDHLSIICCMTICQTALNSRPDGLHARLCHLFLFFPHFVSLFISSKPIEIEISNLANGLSIVNHSLYRLTDDILPMKQEGRYQVIVLNLAASYLWKGERG